MKIAGTTTGITACQLDVKQQHGLSQQLLQRVFSEARKGRVHILNEMSESGGIHQPHEMPDHAPRVVSVKVNRDRARNTLFRDRFRGLRTIGLQCDGAYLIANEQGNEIKVEAPNKMAANRAAQFIHQAVREIRLGEKMTMKISDVRFIVTKHWKLLKAFL